ncbi:Ger(x)C family spore germination protein [Neobacillus sp. 179-C4.2 HS]|uniref:Ger(X)C family spore germination protein n=1 Tax=Neobacillus driksii TaxID=3035913 RepID=A0ABV4YZY5_9BACI|nr:Ger(x)C family spore germination protein [Neobacillus sp. 179.-C4.2 HS]MDP5197364.1 Ger(x)C family spore germination protein [Neobacillus sp. 179.-C4.2 HS]
MNKINRLMCSLVIIGTTLLLSGCWSKKELTDLAIVAALGIDKNEEGRYVGTLQIINPSNVAGGMQGGGGSQGPPVSVITGTGDTIVELSRRTSRKLSRRLYYAHTNLVVISEDLAKEESISSILDSLERDAEFRSTAIIVIAQGEKAADIVKVLTLIDKIPANKVIKTLKFTERTWGENISVSMQEAIKTLVSPGKELVVSGFRISGDVEKGKKMENTQQTEPSSLLYAGSLAIFKQGKLTAWINGETARGSVFLLDKLNASAIDVKWEEKDEAVVYELIRQKTKVSAKMEKGKPLVSIKVQAEGNIGEARVPIDLTNPDVLLKVEKVIEKEIKKEISMAVKQAQKNRSDIFGFGEALHRTNPKEWKKIAAKWNDIYFPEVKIDIVVDAFIRRTGLRNNPHQVNK